MQVVKAMYKGKEYWKVIANPNLTEYDIYPYPGDTFAAIGFDPMEQSYRIAFLLKPYAMYTKEDLENSTSLTELVKYCNTCSVLTQVRKASSGSVVKKHMGVSDAEELSPGNEAPEPEPAKAMVPYQQVMSEPMEYSAMPRVSSGDLIKPKYVSALVSVAEGALCTDLGKLALSTVLSLFTDMAAGWSDDPGQRRAFQELSDTFADGMQLCPESKARLAGDIRRFKEAWAKDGALAAMQKGMIRDAEAVLRDAGIKADVEVGVKVGGEAKVKASIKPVGVVSMMD